MQIKDSHSIASTMKLYIANKLNKKGFKRFSSLWVSIVSITHLKYQINYIGSATINI